VVEHALKLRAAAERRARAEGDVNLRYNEVWCATDVDDIALSTVEEAARLAEAEGIGFALSHPCIELWLLLHFRDSPGARHRDELGRLLRGFVVGYNKHIAFECFQGGYAKAVRRARLLERDAEGRGEPRRNPSTGFHRLTESIRGEAPLPDP